MSGRHPQEEKIFVEALPLTGGERARLLDEALARNVASGKSGAIRAADVPRPPCLEISIAQETAHYTSVP